MRSITVVSSESVIEERVLGLFGEEMAVRKVWSDEWRDPSVAVLEICAANPSVVVLANMDAYDALVLTTDIDRRNPAISVIVVIHELDSKSTMELLRAGARDVLQADASDEDMRTVIGAALSLAAERQRSLSERGNGPPRRIVVVVGPKGGSGKTTVSTNLAVGAAKRFPGHVLLVDLDTQFGDVASALGIEPEHTIADAVNVGLNQRTALKVFLSLHESGLAFMAAPTSFTEADALEDDDIKRTMAALAEEYPMVIVDTAAGIDEASLVAMEFASDIIFVTSPDVPAVRAVQRQLDALDAIGLIGPRRHMVVNRSDSRVGLSVGDIEDTIGLQAEFRVPGSRQIPVSTNEGKPLVLGDRRDKATRPLQDMIDFFAPEPAQAAASRSLGWLRRKEA